MTKSNDQKMSCFFCREFLAAYLESRLDKVREEKIKNHLKECQSCQQLYSKVKAAQKVVLNLAFTHPPKEMISLLDQERKFWTEVRKKYGWRQWPSSLQWAAELGLVAIALVLTINLFPWLNLARTLQKARDLNTSTIAEILKFEGAKEKSDEELLKPEASPQAKVVELPVFGPPLPANWRRPGDTTTSQAAGVFAAASPMAVSSVPSLSATIASPGVPPGASPAEDVTMAQQAGYVWLGNLKVATLDDELAQKITQRIKDLGGIKAGKVELGWRQNDSRYYHFILPEGNYAALSQDLDADGVLELRKEKHPRVIKMGFMRIIMTVEESGE